MELDYYLPMCMTPSWSTTRVLEIYQYLFICHYTRCRPVLKIQVHFQLRDAIYSKLMLMGINRKPQFKVRPGALMSSIGIPDVTQLIPRLQC